LIKRAMVIYHRFGILNVHEHPHLQAATVQFKHLLQAMGQSEEQIQQAFAAIGEEARQQVS